MTTEPNTITQELSAQDVVRGLVVDGDMVAVAWTGTLASGAEVGKGVTLYRTSGGLLRSTRHALFG